MNKDLIRMAAGVSIGRKRFKSTLMVDKSSSIRMRRLVKALCGATDQIITGLAEHSGSLVRVGLFDADYQILTGDKKPLGDVWGQFEPAEKVARCPIAEHYETGHGTWLERYLARELQVLGNSFDADEAGAFTHVLFLITDGIDTAPADKKRAEIPQQMLGIKSRAHSCGGITQSRIVAFYVGVGLTEEQHRQQAAAYGFPPEWVMWVKGDAENVTRMGEDVSHTVMDMGRGGHTVIGRPVNRIKDESDSHPLTPVS